MKELLIYGATGYVGKILASYMSQKAYRPILASRSDEVKQIASKYGFSYRVFSLEDAKDNLHDVKVLVNLAGPFMQSQKALIPACLDTRTHYLDITGEVRDVKHAYNWHKKACDQKVVILPAAGFGVVPTDIAAHLACSGIKSGKQKLTISYLTHGAASRGTLYTLFRDIDTPGIKVRNHQEEVVKPAEMTTQMHFNNKRQIAVYNPWRADLFVAGFIPGVADIETYTVFPSWLVPMMRSKRKWLKKLFLKQLIRRLPEGPSAKQLARGFSYIEARAQGSDGTETRVEIKGPDPYVFTLIALEHMIQKASEESTEFGYRTPSSFDFKWIHQHPDIHIREYSNQESQETD